MPVLEHASGCLVKQNKPGLNLILQGCAPCHASVIALQVPLLPLIPRPGDPALDLFIHVKTSGPSTSQRGQGTKWEPVSRERNALWPRRCGRQLGKRLATQPSLKGWITPNTPHALNYGSLVQDMLEFKVHLPRTP